MTTTPTSAWPVAVIGAGPVGLAAAAHLLARGETPLVLEAGPAVGAAIREWRHVRFFSPWKYTLDSASVALLEPTGWRLADPEAAPSGADIVERYLEPLARVPRIAPHIRLGARVVAITRLGHDKMKTPGRADAPFVLRVKCADGAQEQVFAKAVIDASGTWRTPNPLGADGLPAQGEADAADRIVYGMPDVLGADRARYAGQRVLVVGSGHSAFNVLLDLAALPHAHITWAVRRAQVGQLFGGEQNDALPARGRLGTRTRQLVESGQVRYVSTRIAEVRSTGDALSVVGEDGRLLGPFDEVICATGFRPDLSLTRELRLELDPAVEAPSALAPLIDPNLHSCGSVPPHGAEQLRHPEPDFYTVGMKSYGRAPTFLLLTGYEQVRSVVAAIAGDWEAARQVQLVLPETGVCSTSPTISDASADLFQVVAAAVGSGPLAAGEATACCSTVERATCCEPADKPACCGSTSATSSTECGCR